MFKYLSPTQLCKAHEKIHRFKHSKGSAEIAIKELSKWNFMLRFISKGNIYFRHQLTLSALEYKTGNINWRKRSESALECMKILCKNGLYIEGYSYFNYCLAAYKFWNDNVMVDKWKYMEDIITEQNQKFKYMATKDGCVPTTDTNNFERLTADPIEYYTCDAFTVSRKEGVYILVHHDISIKKWRFNFHINMTFGRVVKNSSQWEWYTAWPNKKFGFKEIIWRIFPPTMKVIEKTERKVVLQLGSEFKIIRFW